MSDELVTILWFMVIGVLLIGMTLGGSFIKRLPLSAAMLYLAAGYGIGPGGLGLLVIDPMRDAHLLERLTEVAVLISLFTAGLKLELPFADRRWGLPVRLATVSMFITVGAVTLLGVYFMGMSLGAAVLLGGILSPTDPVLASDVQVTKAEDRDRLRFGLTGEGSLNDGTAFPFVMLGLGLLSLHDLGTWGWKWFGIDVVWSVAGGLAIGYVLGIAVGRIILWLRIRHREAMGSDEFIALGLIALAYAVALLFHTYGFLAVFAAGLALRRMDEYSETAKTATEPVAVSPDDTAATIAPAELPATMMKSVQRFNVQLEHFAEVAVVLVVGALLTVVELRTDVIVFILALFLVIRPAAVYAGLIATRTTPPQRRLMAWFGIRGIGSIYYLMYAITHHIDPMLAERLISLTLAVVVASIFAHGISVTPLMARYRSKQPRED